MSGPYAPGPYQPQPPKQLTRSRTDKFLGGVCGGVARYLNMDPTLVRVLWVVASLVTSGAGVIVYIVMLFVVREEDTAPPPQVDGPGGYGPASQPAPQQYGQQHAQQGDVWGSGGAPWDQPSQQSSSQPSAQDAPKKGDDPVS